MSATISLSRPRNPGPNGARMRISAWLCQPHDTGHSHRMPPSTRVLHGSSVSSRDRSMRSRASRITKTVVCGEDGQSEASLVDEVARDERYRSSKGIKRSPRFSDAYQKASTSPGWLVSKHRTALGREDAQKGGRSERESTFGEGDANRRPLRSRGPVLIIVGIRSSPLKPPRTTCLTQPSASPPHTSHALQNIASTSSRPPMRSRDVIRHPPRVRLPQARQLTMWKQDDVR